LWNGWDSQASIFLQVSWACLSSSAQLLRFVSLFLKFGVVGEWPFLF
jgi:hypothetical protein